MRVVGSVRVGMVWLAFSAAVVLGWALMAACALAAGDANEAGCPASTESSPGFRVLLPDCRAYEIVSESNSGDAANVTGSFGFPEGVHVYYKSFLPTPGAGAGDGLPERFLATRGAAGWVQRAISPPQGEGPSHLSLGAQENAEGMLFTGDFSEAFVRSMFQDPFEAPRLNQTTGMGSYRLSVGSGVVSLVSLPDSGELTQAMIETPAYAGLAEVNDWGAFLAGGSADGGRAFFVTTAKLATAPGSPQDTHGASDEVYERVGGHTYLVGVLPDGEVPVCGAEVGRGVPSTLGGGLYSYGAVAPSGANVVFFTPGPQAGLVGVPCSEAETGLFLRDVLDGTTVRLPGSSFAGRAGTGAGEEEKIFTLGEGGLYEYHVSSRRVEGIGEGNLLAYSADGSRVYFLGAEGISVYHDGEAKLVPGTESGGYIAKSGGGEIGGSGEYGDTANMPVASGGSSDGSHLLFIDSAQLTGYKNKGHFEAYVYDAQAGELGKAVTCISCNPGGEPQKTLQEEEEEVAREEKKSSEVLRTQLIDLFAIDVGEQQYQTPSPPFISDDGSRAVFETNEALVPQDVNGTMDVYEWEREGAEGCSAESLHVKSLAESPAYSARDGGCLYMLSSGLGAEVPNENGISDGTHLVGASENLQDVYIQTSESLLPGLDNASKLYDARIDGGFPYSPFSHGCEPGRCRTTGGEAAVSGESTTEAFAGPGDVKGASAGGRKSPGKSARERRLKRALRACRRRRSRRRRVRCERRVRERYGAGGASRSAHGRGGGSR